jgi:hypothetical protein
VAGGFGIKEERRPLAMNFVIDLGVATLQKRYGYSPLK